MKLSANFSREEFACKCGCGFNTVDAVLLIIAEAIRSEIGPYSPASGCRCEKHNKAIGGSAKSQHLLGRAMDVHVTNPQKLYSFLDGLYPNIFGIGVYSWGIHIDTRDSKARW